ncbi:hypothetical protein Btru_009322 [Bulinus truncatus]|nr:hypothetical protein Btru_009322 [Bulinus truncatus]
MHRRQLLVGLRAVYLYIWTNQFLNVTERNELSKGFLKGKRDAYTASTLYTLAGRFANRLRRQGFQHQDVIANTLPNSTELVVTDLGIMMAGCIAYTAEFFKPSLGLTNGKSDKVKLKQMAEEKIRIQGRQLDI